MPFIATVVRFPSQKESQGQPYPKLVTELGMVMEDKLLQYQKQLYPKLVTEYVMPL